MYRLIFYCTLLLLCACDADETILPSLNDWYISGEINGSQRPLPQVDLPNVNVSNTYFREFKETHLQAYRNESDPSDGYWKIRLSDLDLENITPPINVEQSFFSVSWHDSKILEIDDERCGDIDQGCAFFSASDRFLLTITELTDTEIVGVFSGRLLLTGTGFGVFQDPDQFVDVTNGSFRIAYRVDPN